MVKVDSHQTVGAKELILSVMEKSISFVREVDEDKPNSDHFRQFHTENRGLIEALKRAKGLIKRFLK